MSANNRSEAKSSQSIPSRNCHIVKRPNFDGYGFNLHSEKIKPGQYIGKVDANSPAEAAGLREGDQIIGVNGVNIGNETHKQVVQRIKAISNEVHLLLINPNTNAMSSNSNSQDTSEKDVSNSKSMTNVEANLRISNATSTKQNINQEVDGTEFLSNTTNGHQTRSNKQNIESKEPITHKTAIDYEEGLDSLNQNCNSKMNIVNRSMGLNLNLTAAEMRAKLFAKKKIDPKNESVDLRKKFDIIQKL